MGLMQPISATSHPYANGATKQMLIDGKWQDAQSGKTFETHNPATGELLATVAEGDAKDIDLAVAAARHLTSTGRFGPPRGPLQATFAVFQPDRNRLTPSSPQRSQPVTARREESR